MVLSSAAMLELAACVASAMSCMETGTSLVLVEALGGGFRALHVGDILLANTRHRRHFAQVVVGVHAPAAIAMLLMASSTSPMASR